MNSGDGTYVVRAELPDVDSVLTITVPVGGEDGNPGHFGAARLRAAGDRTTTVCAAGVIPAAHMPVRPRVLPMSQQMRGSCSPRGMSTTRRAPTSVRRTTQPAGP